MNTKRFQRHIEDFTCEHCDARVTGSGYTNHCPKCLWSKHVDVNPGDRLASCGGLMEPVDIETKEGEQVLVQRCQKCGHERRNKLQEGDDRETLLMLTSKIVEDKWQQ